MNHLIQNSGYIFFACDTKSSAYSTLFQALKEIVHSYDVGIVTYESTIESNRSALEKVEELIRNSLCVIADVGCDADRQININVGIEVGLARAFKRPLVLICSNPDRLPANLKGKDTLIYPQCVTFGTAAFHQLEDFFGHLGIAILGGRSVRIFDTKSDEYLDALSYITNLTGNVWFVSPELRSFFRPEETLKRWLRDVRKYPLGKVEGEIDRRKRRQNSFLVGLNDSYSYDIYPTSAFHLKAWRGLSLSPEERSAFISNVIRLLDDYPSYEIGITQDNQHQKYWIKEADVGGFVIFEGWDYIDIREHKEIGGLIMRDHDTVNSFRVETEKLLNNSIHDRNKVLDYLKALLYG